MSNHTATFSRGVESDEKGLMSDSEAHELITFSRFLFEKKTRIMKLPWGSHAAESWITNLSDKKATPWCKCETVVKAPAREVFEEMWSLEKSTGMKYSKNAEYVVHERADEKSVLFTFNYNAGLGVSVRARVRGTWLKGRHDSSTSVVSRNSGCGF